MERFQYRGRARVVAIVDLVLTSISLVVPILLFIAAVGGTFYESKIQEKLNEDGRSSDADLQTGVTLILIFLWVMFFVSLSIVVLQMVAAVKLLNATQIGLDPKTLRAPARFWRIVTIVFTIISILGLIVRIGDPSMIIYIPSIMFHCIGIHIVGKFIEEAEAALYALPSHLGHGGQVGFTANADAGTVNNAPPGYEQFGKQ